MFHLKHEINSRENFSKNDKLLEEAIKKRKHILKKTDIKSNEPI